MKKIIVIFISLCLFTASGQYKKYRCHETICPICGESMFQYVEVKDSGPYFMDDMMMNSWGNAYKPECNLDKHPLSMEFTFNVNVCRDCYSEYMPEMKEEHDKLNKKYDEIISMNKEVREANAELRKQRKIQEKKDEIERIKMEIKKIKNPEKYRTETSIYIGRSFGKISVDSTLYIGDSLIIY